MTFWIRVPRGHPGRVLRDPVALLGVDAPVVREEEDGVLGVGHQGVEDDVVLGRLAHADDALAAPVLLAEGAEVGALGVAVPAEGHHHVGGGDGLVEGEAAGLLVLDRGAAVVGALVADVLLAEFLVLALDLGADEGGVGEQGLQVGDLPRKLGVLFLQPQVVEGPSGGAAACPGWPAPESASGRSGT